MVLAQLGVAALPAMAADVISGAGIVWRPLISPVIRRSIGLVKRREGSLSPAAQAMLALLKQQTHNSARGYTSAKVRKLRTNEGEAEGL